MAYQILAAEDEPRLAAIIQDYFLAHGADCTLAKDGEEALDLLRAHDYDAVLLDVMMPGADGFAVCRAVRERSGVPVLFLTALGGEEYALHGYELGADDYITKPFSLAVLYAKTMALIRRTAGSSSEVLTCGAVTVHPGPRTCAVSGQPCPLSPRAFDLLLCLMRNRGQVLSREQLLDKVWGLDFEGDSRAVDVQIKNLRAALGPAGKQIKTVYKAGYQLKEGAK
ncbi:response regulator transcription factor [Pseudoflavonifractor phocaeensis]|uniref:response regulator transcription factor n=1 Tax=Pseudoflavonifractor phocaeensis TaxID=1870988 RepID=UPI001FAFC755|nr:response regulator transcription factor [Pseudoflavonifractor phocaeensis]